MAVYRVVAVDEDGNPQKGVTIAAYSLEDFPNIVGREVTDKAGSAFFTVTGPVFFDVFHRRGADFRGDRDYPGEIRIQVVGIGPIICYDYVVDCSGFGTHETLSGTTGAWAAAVAAGGNKTIWVCCSETLSDSLPLDDMDDSSIAIHASGSHRLFGASVTQATRVMLTAPSGQPMFLYTGSATGDNRIQLRDIGVTVTSGSALVQHNAGNGLSAVEFENVNFNMAGADVVKANGLLNTQTEILLKDCRGSIQYVFNRTGINGSGPDDLILQDTDALAMTSLWRINAGPERCHIFGGVIDTGNVDVSALEFLHVHNLIIRTGATVFTSSTTAQNTRKMSFSDIVLESGGASAKFADLQSAAVNVGTDIFMQGIHGVQRTGSAPSGAFITIDTDFSSVHVADIYAPAWGTAYSGPSGSGFVGTGFAGPFLPTVFITGVPTTTDDMLILNHTSTGGSTIEWQRSGTARANIGLWPTTAPSPFDANDLYFAVNDGTQRNVAAFDLSDYRWKLNTNEVINGWGRVGAGSGFTNPTNTTDGDWTATRFFVNDDSNFSLQVVSANPRLVLDSDDFLQYLRGSDRYEFVIGAGNVAELDGNGDLRVAGYTRVGSLTAPTNTTDGDITGLRMSLGNRALGGANGAIVDISATVTDTAAASRPFMLVNPIIAPATNSSSDFRTLYYSAFLTPATGATMNVVTAGYFEIRDRSDATIGALSGLSTRPLVVDSSSPATVGVVALTVGLDVFHHVRPSGTSSVNTTSAVGVRFPTARIGSGYTADTLRDIHIVGMNFGAVVDYIGIDLERPTTSPSGVNLALRSNGRMAYTPTTQTLAAATNTIVNTARIIELSNSTAASLTLTSTPTISTTAAADGQLMTLVNDDSADDIVLQDESVLAGSALRLPGAANLTLGPRDSATFYFNAGAGEWYCIATTNL